MTNALIFYDPAFPMADGQTVSADMLEGIGRIVCADGLSGALHQGRIRMFRQFACPKFS
ncbi:hypothetical protein [Cohnella sp.]|uniref:hypothetical protein n=1 Tax=Cohnella sp. TaxID=1883426 RepID=UPI0035638315